MGIRDGNVVRVGGIMTGQMEAGRSKWAPEKSLAAFLAPRVANIPLPYNNATADERR